MSQSVSLFSPSEFSSNSSHLLHLVRSSRLAARLGASSGAGRPGTGSEPEEAVVVRVEFRLLCRKRY